MENNILQKVKHPKLDKKFPHCKPYIEQIVLDPETVELTLKFDVKWYRIEPERKIQYAINTDNSMSDGRRILDFITYHCNI